MADGPPVVESIPPIPRSSVQDIEGWLSNRNCELRNALEFGDSATVARLGTLVAQEVLCMEYAKHRCVEVVPLTLGNHV